METGNESYRFLRSTAVAKKRVEARGQGRQIEKSPPPEADIRARAARANPRRLSAFASSPRKQRKQRSIEDEEDKPGRDGRLPTADHHTVGFGSGVNLASARRVGSGSGPTGRRRSMGIDGGRHGAEK